MANDYSLFIVDWPRLESQFETSPIANIHESDWVKLEHHERAQAASAFLNCLWEEDFAIHLSDITRFHGASGSFHLWGALGATYSEIRRYLAVEDMEVYDDLYLPFIAPYFMEDLEDKDHPIELPEKLVKRLMVGGLYLALSPGRCNKMGKLFYHYSFSRLVHEALALRSIPPPLPDFASYFHDMIDGVETTFGRLHGGYTEMTEGWRILTQQASHRKWGVIAKYHI
jgi:hypothetical protein